MSAKPNSSSRQLVEFVSGIVRGAVSPSVFFVFLPHPVFELYVSLAIPVVQNIILWPGFYPGTSWGNIPQTSEIPQEFQDCLDFMWLGK